MGERGSEGVGLGEKWDREIDGVRGLGSEGVEGGHFEDETVVLLRPSNTSMMHMKQFEIQASDRHN